MSWAAEKTLEEVEMKRNFMVAVSAALLLASCSTLKTSVDYDRSANFSTYKTFSWRDSGEIRNPLLAKRIEAAVTSELSKKGLTQASGDDADLWVVAHPRLSQETQVTTYNSGWGYGWRYRGGGVSTAKVEQIPVGTLIVDLVDAKQKELVWRGIASDTLKPENSPEEKEMALAKAVAEMFAKYPPAGS
jgi:Domain of unknown function (DUF4136)